MKEPLKGKRLETEEVTVEQNGIQYSKKGSTFLYLDSDVASAIKWLKERCEEYTFNDRDLEYLNLIINETFEDITKKDGNK